MTARVVQARAWPVSRPWTVRAPSGASDESPGNVGVCLSGGGSRAMVAGMGQLRGLAHLRAGGKSLLSQVKALSAVSGGAWLAVPYTFLRGDVTDEDFLGPMVQPEDLVPVRLPGVEEDRALTSLRPGNIGQVAANPAFGIAGLALLAARLKSACDVPDHELWQAIVGANVLEPYGLHESPGISGRGAPSLFTLDAERLREIVAANPSLAGVRAHLVADRLDPSRGRRPYLVCHGSMLLTRPGEDFQLPAPVQFTPLFAGCVGEPDGLDGNGHEPGGLVEPFAFDGVLLEKVAEGVAVRQERPFSLVDVTGISSAFLAEPLRNALAHLMRDPLVRDGISSRVTSAVSTLPESLRRSAEEAAAQLAADAPESEALQAMRATDLFVPAYHSFSVRGGVENESHARTSFADGGYGDNTGIAGLLAHDDIDTVIAFVNAPERLAAGGRGVLDERGREIEDSRILVSPQVPPLFGYQPHREGVGYRLYAGDPGPCRPELRYNQVFEPSRFAPLLRALWEPCGDGALPGSFARPAIARMRLRVVANRWYGVRGRGGPGDPSPDPVTLVLVYLSRVRGFHDRVGAAVRAILGDFDDPGSYGGFPHYSTLSTHLSATQINLLAHQTSWVVTSNPDLFCDLFAPGG